MTHEQRIDWLADRGWLRAPPVPPIDLQHDGELWIWLGGNRGKRPMSAWLRISDGAVEIHGVHEVMSWEQFQEYITKPVKASEPAKKLRTLFDLEGE